MLTQFTGMLLQLDVRNGIFDSDNYFYAFINHTSSIIRKWMNFVSINNCNLER